MKNTKPLTIYKHLGSSGDCFKHHIEQLRNKPQNLMAAIGLIDLHIEDFLGFDSFAVCEYALEQINKLTTEIEEILQDLKDEPNLGQISDALYELSLFEEEILNWIKLMEAIDKI